MIHVFYILIPVFRQKLLAALQIWSSLTPQSILSRDTTQGTKTACQHALESHIVCASYGEDITSCCMLESAEWVAEKTRIQSYQCSIDRLEGLVVLVFEG